MGVLEKVWYLISVYTCTHYMDTRSKTLRVRIARRLFLSIDTDARQRRWRGVSACSLHLRCLNQLNIRIAQKNKAKPVSLWMPLITYQMTGDGISFGSLESQASKVQSATSGADIEIEWWRDRFRCTKGWRYVYPYSPPILSLISVDARVCLIGFPSVGKSTCSWGYG